MVSHLPPTDDMLRVHSARQCGFKGKTGSLCDKLVDTFNNEPPSDQSPMFFIGI